MSDAVLNPSFLSSAFQHVKENHSGAGVDGVTIERFEEDLTATLNCLAQELRDKTYAPLPLLKILVDKGNGEGRALCIPTVGDRVVQTAVLQAIESILEKEFEDCSFGYRKGRSVRQAVHRIKEYFEQGYRWVVDADIDSFFDSVDHATLMEKVKKYIADDDIVRLIGTWIAAEVWDGKSITTLKKGIPQGSPVSPILANLFLDGLDETLLKQNQKIVRFADDFVVLCRSPEKAEEALEITNDVLSRLHLILDESDIVSFDHGFKFLGVTFCRSLVMVPFDREKKERRVLYYPPPFDMQAYRSQKSCVMSRGKEGASKSDKSGVMSDKEL